MNVVNSAAAQNVRKHTGRKPVGLRQGNLMAMVDAGWRAFWRRRGKVPPDVPNTFLLHPMAAPQSRLEMINELRGKAS